MKLIFLLIGVFITSTSNSQTDVIAARSHSGDLSHLSRETANFGLNDMIYVDSVIYIGKECIIEVKTDWNNRQSHDTICNNFYFKEHGYVLREIKKAYPSHTVFIGFMEDDESMIRTRNWPRQNAVSWFVGFVILSAFSYVLFPIFKRN